MKNPSQRVGIFVDVQNLYYSARALYDKRVNFGEILKIGTADRNLVRAVAYTIKAESPEEQSFFDALEKQGYELKMKDLQTFVNGQKKGDWDVGIAVDILKMAPKMDAIVLCSGDGDFEQLLYHIKAEGCLAEVISFGRSTSAKLKEVADDFTDLDQLTDSVLLEHRSGHKKPQAQSQKTQQESQSSQQTTQQSAPQDNPQQRNEQIKTNKPKRYFKFFE